MRFLNSPAFKLGAIGLASVLWLVGLADQLGSYELTARYLVLSAAIAAAAITL
jgi:hypothetical protein